MLDMAKKSKKTRFYEIDFLRGSAIFFMIITHVNAVFQSEYDLVLDKLTWWGATVCFTVFLFCFAFIYGLKLMRQKKLKIYREIKRFLILLAVYLTSAAIAHFFLQRSIDRDTLLSILQFKYLPPYTEFIITFAIYVLVLIFAQKFFKYLLKKPITFIIFSFLIYGLSIYLYKVDGGTGTINDIKALFVGHEHVHSFGVLSYFPVFTLGMISGYIAESKKKRRLINFILLIISLALVFALISYNLSSWYRFPPSVLFLSYGISYCFAIILLYKIIRKLGFIKKYILFLGKNALFIFLANVVVILGLKYYLIEYSFTTLYVWVLQLVVFVVISYLTFFVGKISKYAKKAKI
ncbi:MAG: acyltransferase family protein [Candidatus Magasanikbacteria bacterium]|nr:acyltransferase family protein [Candidatus Magasanikbacteria bacterium]